MKRIVQVRPEIKAAFEAKRNECVNIARERSGKDIPMFPIVFCQMGRRAGVCATELLTGESEIRINPDYFKSPKGYDKQLNETVPHEIAHAVVHFLYPMFKSNDGLMDLFSLMTHNGRRQRTVPPHGREWVSVMEWFGIRNPDTRHQMDMTGVVTKTPVAKPFKYLCDCGTPHQLTFTLHKRIQVEGRHRFCRNCKQRIVYERQWNKAILTTEKKDV